MSREDDRSYIIFSLGFDLLYKRLCYDYGIERDEFYKICEELADKFMDSEFYREEVTKFGLYYLLQAWVDEWWRHESDSFIDEMLKE